ncbi:MAG: hypothetical protein P9M08_11555 [Candidatus Erginobacter occultus]|nr:hypothetical protein [Candidatus Erginobacter occultus]
MDTISAKLSRRRGVAVTAGVLGLLAAASLSAQILNRGKTLEIKSFRPIRLGSDEMIVSYDGKEITKGLEVSFRINETGDFSEIYFDVTLFDSQMLPIRDGIGNVLFDRDSRQATGLQSSYVSSGVRKIDGFKGRRTYQFIFIPRENYRYALAEVGNGDEKVYAVYPRSAKLEDLLPRK